MEQTRPPPIGIDLGTAYIRIAVCNGTNCRMVPDEQGNSAMPSYVAFTNSGLLVGEAARAQAPHNPANTVFDIIRLIGRRYSHPSVRNDMRLWPFKVVASTNDTLQIEVNWRGRLWQFNAVEICAMLLVQIKENAENNLGTSVTEAVITVPACFNYEQRLTIKQAGMIAGLNFTQIISAPAASAFFYGIQRSSKSTNIVSTFARSLFQNWPGEHNMVIFDLGAGTLDVAVVTIKDVCRVRATAGDVHLGGSDFDNNLVDYFVSELKKRGRKDISNIPMAISNLRTLCEKAKISLSSDRIMVPMKITPLYDVVDFESSITEAKFNELNNDLFIECIHVMERCIIDARISGDAVHEVILAGSSTKIPLLKKYIQHFFESNVKALTISQHMETATAYGAAFQAFFLRRRGNERAHSLSLLDASPSSLWLGLHRGTMQVFVPKNMNIPVRIEKTFRTSQRPFVVEVYEGQSTLIGENNFLGKFELSGSQISSSYCRSIDITTNVSVCFEVHENGTLTMMAKDISRGESKSFKLPNNKIEDSQNRVLEALLYKVSGMSVNIGVNKASTTKSPTRSGSSHNWDEVMDSKTLAMHLSTEKNRSTKIRGQSSRQYLEPEEYGIGIDFGTSYSSVAVWQQNGVKIVENEYGNRLTRSVVAFTDNSRLIGDTVHKEQVTTNPASTITNIKCVIGRRYSDQLVSNDIKFLPFKIMWNDKNRPTVSVNYMNEVKHFAPEEIAAMILSKMREIAEVHLNSVVKNVVISVPASFCDSQRKAIKDAGVIAGLNVMQLLNETTAIAIAYFLQKVSRHNSIEENLLIFDLGSGNLDVSIVTIKEGCIRVRAVASDTNMRGEDFDNNLVTYFVEKLMKEKRRDIRNKSRPLRRLRAACEKAKILLSTTVQTVLEIDALDDEIDFHSAVTRSTFEEINTGLFKRCIDCVKRCLEDAEMDGSCIDEVVLAGGSTRIPKMLQLLQEFFNGKELCRSVDANEAVAYGAAVQAAILSCNEDRESFNILEIQDITSLSFGLEHKDGATTNVLLPKHTPIPATKELMITNRIDRSSSFSIEVEECELASTMTFTLSGIPPKPRLKSNIRVSFEVDKSGILNLTAKDTRAREKNEITVNKENRGLTIEEIQKMVKTATRYKVEDEEHKARAAALNSLENFAYKLKGIVKVAGLPASDKKLVEKTAYEAIAWLETNHHADIDKICAWQKKLETIDHQVRSDALSSLENKVNEVKEIANAGVPAEIKKSIDEVADIAIKWLETNQDARIDEINFWTKQLETYKFQVRCDALNSLENMAFDMKALVQDGGVSGSSKKLVETTANEAITWLQTNYYDASIDDFIAWKKQLETAKSHIIYLGTIASMQ